MMPFGLTSAPSTFQSFMNYVFQPHLRKFILFYSDDIIVYSPSWTSHLDHLEQTFKILQQHNLSFKSNKCSFAQSKVEYLGHIISIYGIAADPKQVEAMPT